jgi:hypothetical protein
MFEILNKANCNWKSYTFSRAQIQCQSRQAILGKAVRGSVSQVLANDPFLLTFSDKLTLTGSNSFPSPGYRRRTRHRPAVPANATWFGIRK